MEILEEIEDTKRCFKVKERVMASLNIVYNASNSMFVFWNKYQIFVYENHNFENAAKVFHPEFLVSDIINSNNYLICLDSAGNVQITSLKFKNSTQKRFRSSFQAQAQGILSCTQHSTDTIICIKYKSDAYFLCLYQINAEFQLKKKLAIRCNNSHWPLSQTSQEKCLTHSHAISKDFLGDMKGIFNIHDAEEDYSIILISFDRVSVYSCLFHPKMADPEIHLLKLYTASSEICDFKVTEMGNNLYVIIALTIGTVIRLLVKNQAFPEVIHLNTAISKFLTWKSNDMIIYSDGVSMWKAEETLSKQKIKFSQFFLKQVKDIVKFGDQLICTTYMNLIYTFSIDDESAYIKPVSIDEYCAAETLLNNSEYFYKIMKEVEKCNELSKKLSQESSYITALALSRRQDIMDKVIFHNVVVYESYEDAITENAEVTLTEHLSKYFEENSILFLIKLTSVIIHHIFNDVLSNLFGDLKVHINLFSGEKLLKTTSTRLKETLKKLQLLIPLTAEQIANATEIKVYIKVVTNIPGAIDEKQALWIVLYRKCVTLNSEYFVKSNAVANKVVCFKEPRETIEELILQAACNHHGDLFKFTDISKVNTNTTQWDLYVKLPNNFTEIFKTESYFREHFNAKKAMFFVKEMASEEFLKSQTDLCFEIGNDKVRIEVVSYFCKPMLKVSSNNIRRAFDIRNFLANSIHNDFKGRQPGIEFVAYALYTTTENIQKAVKNCILSPSKDDIPILAEQFHRAVYGTLPL